MLLALSAPDFLVDFPGLNIFDLPISRKAFEIAGLPVYWYGLLIAGALILCMLLAIRQAPKFKLTSDDVMDTFIAIIPLMIIFARLYYVVLEWEYYAADWKRIFDTRGGGLAFYGGVIGGALAILLVTRLKKIKISSLLDFLVVYVPLGQAIGRWGNFFNQEAFGTNTALPWGMYSNQTAAYLTSIGGYDPSLPVHPTFFYEFIGNMIIFVILYRLRKTSKTPFTVTLWYLLLYGFIRFFVEGIRTDPLIIGDTGIRASQLLSALMVIFSVIMLIVLRRRRLNRELAEALAEDQPSASPESIGEPAGERVFIEISDEPETDATAENAGAGSEAASDDAEDIPAAVEESSGETDESEAVTPDSGENGGQDT